MDTYESTRTGIEAMLAMVKVAYGVEIPMPSLENCAKTEHALKARWDTCQLIMGAVPASVESSEWIINVLAGQKTHEEALTWVGIGGRA